MATAQQTPVEEKPPVQSLMEANTAVVNTMVEAGYKAQTRGLNMVRVFIEGAGRQQANGRKLVEQLADTTVPFNSPERVSVFMNVMVENQNEALRIGREYIDELNAAAAEVRQTFETIVAQAGKAREAQQALYAEGFRAARSFAGSIGNQTAEAVRA